MLIVWLEDDGRAFSAFARHVCVDGPRLDFPNDTIAFDPVGRFPRHAAGFGPIFEGQSQLVWIRPRRLLNPSAHSGAVPLAVSAWRFRSQMS